MGRSSITSMGMKTLVQLQRCTVRVVVVIRGDIKTRKRVLISNISRKNMGKRVGIRRKSQGRARNKSKTSSRFIRRGK